MSDVNPLVTPSSENPHPVVPPNAANPTTAAAAVSTNVNLQQAGSSTTFRTMEDIKKENPELYNKMMQGIATSILSDLRKHQGRLKAAMRKSREAYS